MTNRMGFIGILMQLAELQKARANLASVLHARREKMTKRHDNIKMLFKPHDIAGVEADSDMREPNVIYFWMAEEGYRSTMRGHRVLHHESRHVDPEQLMHEWYVERGFHLEGVPNAYRLAREEHPSEKLAALAPSSADAFEKHLSKSENKIIRLFGESS